MSFSILYSVLLNKLWHNAKARASGGTADAVVSKTSEETRVGSNPTSRTIEFKELPDMAALLVFPAHRLTSGSCLHVLCPVYRTGHRKELVMEYKAEA